MKDVLFYSGTPCFHILCFLLLFLDKFWIVSPCLVQCNYYPILAFCCCLFFGFVCNFFLDSKIYISVYSVICKVSISKNKSKILCIFTTLPNLFWNDLSFLVISINFSDKIIYLYLFHSPVPPYKSCWFYCKILVEIQAIPLISTAVILVHVSIISHWDVLKKPITCFLHVVFSIIQSHNLKWESRYFLI